MHPHSVLLLGFLLAPAITQAQDVFPDVEYISGKDGFPDKIKGELIVSDSAVVFARKTGETLFTIPIASLTQASNNTEENPGSTGRKLLLGIFANKKEEFVYPRARRLKPPREWSSRPRTRCPQESSPRSSSG